MDNKFSYYNPPITNKKPNKEVTLREVFSLVSGGSFKSQTQTLRRYLEEGKEEEYKESKKTLLPTVTFGGVFSPEGRSTANILSPTGYITLDFDHLEEQGQTIEEIKSILRQDTEIGLRLLFVSPSGDGIKAVCKSLKRVNNGEEYKEVYNSLKYYLESKYKGLKLDKSGSNIDRTCLLCYDPESILLESGSYFNPDLHPVPKRETPKREYKSYDFADDGIEEIVRRVEESGIDLGKEYGDYYSLVCSFKALGERGREYLHRVCRVSPKYNPDNTDKDFNEVPKHYFTDIGVFVNMAKDMGIDTSRGEDWRYTRVEEKRVNREVINSTEMADNTRQESREEQLLREYYSPFTEETLKEIASQKREGIETGYLFGEGKRKENLILRSGAITLVCGKSSHGKSKLLQNLSLQIARDIEEKGEEGTVLFFSYEEDLRDTLPQFANIYSGEKELSCFGTPNTEVLNDFLSTGKLPRATKQKASLIQDRLLEFKSLLLKNRLRVNYTIDLEEEDLITLINEICKVTKVKAVFIDYIQLLYKRDWGKRDRLEEIKQICRDLVKCATGNNIPIVLGAQLNRETPSPVEMSGDNIADSSNLTRYANTIVNLWNSSFTDMKNTGFNNSEEYLKNLCARGFVLGQSGKLYVKLSKNRGGTPNIDAVLDFVGETGQIISNDPKINKELEDSTGEYSGFISL